MVLKTATESSDIFSVTTGAVKTLPTILVGKHAHFATGTCISRVDYLKSGYGI